MNPHRLDGGVHHDREQLRLLFEQLPGVIWSVDRDLVFTSSAGAGLPQMGLSANEVLGQTLFTYFGTEDREFPPIAAHLQAMEGRQSSFDFAWAGRHFECHVEPFRNSEGEISGAIGVAIDTTDSAAAREALQLSERRYQTLFEESRDAIYLSTLDGELIGFNQAMLDLLGYSREQMQELNAETLYAEPHARRHFRQTIAREGAVKDYEVKLLARDGRILDCLLTSTLQQGEDGSVIGYQGIIHDVTERKRAEERLRREKAFSDAALDSLPGLFYLFAEDGPFLRWNRNFETVTGYSAHEIAGMRPQDLFSPDDRPAVSECLRQVLHQGQSSIEVDLVCKDGSRKPHYFTGRLVLLDGQRCVVGMAIDVADRHRLEHELRQSQKMEAIGQLAGGIAHDFNNVLTIILANTEFLLRQLSSSDDRRTEVEEIREAARRAANLTRQLLAFSRKQVMQPKLLNLNAVVQNLENMLQRLIGEDIHLMTALSPNLWSVEADPGQMEQMIMNLAANARDALPLGGIFTVETMNREVDERFAADHYPMEPGDYVVLIVSDNGSGMSAEVRSRVFEPFFTTKRRGRGTGLGLSTVFGIVKQTGGFIWVHSLPGEGTTFTVYLPRARSGAPVVVAPEQKTPSRGGAETVLLAEDEAPVRFIARRALERSGYTVLDARDGQEAMEIAMSHGGSIDLLLTDVVMPGLHGNELAARLLAHRPEMTVLYMSGYSDHAVLSQDGERLAGSFLQKPFTPDDLTRKVREVIDAGRRGTPGGVAKPSAPDGS